MAGLVGASRRGLEKGDGADQDGEEEWFHGEMVQAQSSQRKIEARNGRFLPANREFRLRMPIASATNRTCSV